MNETALSSSQLRGGGRGGLECHIEKKNKKNLGTKERGGGGGGGRNNLTGAHKGVLMHLFDRGGRVLERRESKIGVAETPGVEK